MSLDDLPQDRRSHRIPFHIPGHVFVQEYLLKRAQPLVRGRTDGLRRRGIGTKILQHLCDQARSLGYRELVLETTAWWEDAIAFYECQGFRRIDSPPGEAQFEMRLSEG